jgi:hypothetical protein
MKRPASLAAGVLALSVLVATPAQAQPRFFFDQGYHAVGFWESTTATERTTTSVSFLAVEQGSRPGERTITFLGYFSLTETWDGSKWQEASSVSALAHSDRGDAITYEIGPGGRTITASATAPAMECVPSFPNCTPIGTVALDASWVATGEDSDPENPPGHHITDWSGFGCDIDFRSGRTLGVLASASATIDGVAPPGDPIIADSGIQSFRGVEVLFCK